MRYLCLVRRRSLLQVHGSDVGVGEAAVFFLPHKPPGTPLGEPQPPLFLLMRGTGWCASACFHGPPVAAALFWHDQRRLKERRATLPNRSAGGADHYEPLLAVERSSVGPPPAFVM